MSDDKGERKPVAAVMPNEKLIVVCDDGSVWRRTAAGTVWRKIGSGTMWGEMDAVPGTRRARELAEGVED